jgi:hypothetical protein
MRSIWQPYCSHRVPLLTWPSILQASEFSTLMITVLWEWFSVTESFFHSLTQTFPEMSHFLYCDKKSGHGTEIFIKNWLLSLVIGIIVHTVLGNSSQGPRCVTLMFMQADQLWTSKASDKFMCCLHLWWWGYFCFCSRMHGACLDTWWWLQHVPNHTVADSELRASALIPFIWVLEKSRRLWVESWIMPLMTLSTAWVKWQQMRQCEAQTLEATVDFVTCNWLSGTETHQTLPQPS